VLRHTMTFRTQLPSPQARTLMLNWLTSIGYRLNSAPFLSSIDASRGSSMGNLGSLNPKMWNARVRAIFTPMENECEVELELTVSTLGQIFTNSDVEYWTYELTETVGVICGRRPEPNEFLKATKKAQWGNGWRAIFLTIVAVAVLIASGALTQSVWVAAIATVATCVGFYFLFRAPRKLAIVAPKPFAAKQDESLAPPIPRY